jgi:hypothetical protein
MKKVFLFFTFSFLLFACGYSKEELTKEVRKSMEAEFFKDQNNIVRIKSFILVKKNETEYLGLLETEETLKSNLSLKEDFKYNVQVFYDGKSFRWEVVK